MADPWQIAGTVAGLAISFTSLIIAMTAKRQEPIKQLQNEMNMLRDKHDQELISLRTDFSAYKVKADIFWSLVEEHMSQMLKRPTHHEMDRLLDKLRAHTINLEECQALKHWLHEVYTGNTTSTAVYRMIATFVTAAVEARIVELTQAGDA